MAAAERSNGREAGSRSTGDDAARFRAITEHAFDLISEVDEEAMLTYVCPQVEAHLGYAPEELLGRDAGYFVHPDDRDRTGEWLGAIMAGTERPSTFRLRTRDGRWLTYETSGSAYDSTRGRRAVLVSRDLTDRQHSQEEELRAVLNHLRDGVVIMDDRLRALFLNPAMAEMLGYTVEELLRVPTSAVAHPDDLAESVVRDRRRAAGEDVPARNRMRLFHRDGHVVLTDVLATPYVRDGVVRGILSEFRDVSDQIAAQEALAASEARYRELFELVQDGLIFLGPDGKPALVNEAFCRMLGYTREEVMERDRMDFVHPEEREVALEGNRHREASDETRRFSRRLVRQDGTTVHTEAQVASLFQGGEYAGVLVVHTDLTERLALEQEAHLQRERAQRAALREELMAVVSHELRTPLTSILGFGELLELGVGGELSDLQREYVQEMLRAGDHLLQLINDVLDLSRMEAHQLVIRPERCAPGPIVQGVVQALEPLAQRAGIRLAARLSGAPLAAEVDPRAFRQVVTNLVSNAVKFTEAGSVTVSLAAEGERLVLVVEDSGIGIAPEHLEDVFEAFRQAESGLDRPYGGSGLGLTIATRLVELHGGQVMLCSVPGEGTTVRVSVPLEIHSAAKEPSTGAP